MSAIRITMDSRKRLFDEMADDLWDYVVTEFRRNLDRMEKRIYRAAKKYGHYV